MALASVSVTGSRRVPPGGLDLIGSALRAIGPVEKWSTGAAFGADTEIFYMALRMWPEAVHRVVYPVGVAYNERIIQDAEFLGLELVPVTGPASASLYLKRNGVLLEGVTTVAAFPSTGQEVLRSGTWATVRLARRRGLPIVVFPLDGSRAWSEDGVVVES